jgi:hypothetical protein
MTLTNELPETLTKQLRARGVSDKEIESIVVAVSEAWLAQPPQETAGRFSESAVPFVKQFIAQNRELFEALSKV